MDLSGWDRTTSPYHPGEQELHDRLGRKEAQTAIARNIHRPYMTQQHQAFFAQLPVVFAGSVDAEGWPWASALFGKPGFLTSPDDRHLHIGGGRISGDPFWENAQPGAPVGFVGVDLRTRRRNRLNGVVRGCDRLSVDVVQSYGNCPQYIHTRGEALRRDPSKDLTPPRAAFTELPDDVARLITTSDTFFVASHNDRDDPRDTGGVDVSHRGGKPGFIKVEGNSLTVPEYMGNFAFNTLGNFLVNSKAGLLFIDFTSGDLVQLTGRVDLLWEPDDAIRAFKGAQRAWRFHLERGQVLRAAAPLRWEAREPSPNVAMTGDWAEAAQTQALRADQHNWRPFRVIRVVQESRVIRSFYLTPDDGKGMLPFEPGQFLTLRLTPDGERPLTRTYTLSSGPDDLVYQISVKRDGVASTRLHDQFKVGDLLDVRAPKGAFTMDVSETRPAVLLAGGVGITPMVSMARAAHSHAVSHRHHRPLTVIHAARSTGERAFATELLALERASGGALRYVSVISTPEPGELTGEAFHAAGRLSPALLRAALPRTDCDVYLCGPAGFMQAAYDMLIGLGVGDSRILAESFGPASLTRTGKASGVDPAETAIVRFSTSGVEHRWTTGDGTLLEFAETHGLSPAFGCRSGTCGSCACKFTSGQVSYAQAPSFVPAEGEALLCCAVPGRSDTPLSIEI